MFLMQLMEARKWPCIFIGIISQEHSRNKELEFSKGIAPSKLPEAKGVRYVSDRLYLISMADSESYASTNHD